jgi:hypothetical protein
MTTRQARGARGRVDLAPQETGKVSRASRVVSLSDFLDGLEFRQQLKILHGAGVICAVEQTILEHLYHGAKFAELATDPAMQKMLRERGMTFPQLIEDLHHRIESSRIPEGAHDE